MSISKREVGYSTMFQRNIDFIVSCKSRAAINLFLFLVQEVKPFNGNIIFIRRKDIASEFSVGLPAVSKWINRLKKEGMVKEVWGGFMLNPFAIWKDKFENLNKGRAIWTKVSMNGQDDTGKGR